MKLVVGGKEKGQMERNETTLQSRFGQEVRERAASSRQGLSRSESPVGGKDAATRRERERSDLCRPMETLPTSDPTSKTNSAVFGHGRAFLARPPWHTNET